MHHSGRQTIRARPALAYVLVGEWGSTGLQRGFLSGLGVGNHRVTVVLGRYQVFLTLPDWGNRPQSSVARPGTGAKHAG